MAKSLNKVQLIGRMGNDPELRSTNTGVQVASFPLATHRQWTAKDGTAAEETEWHNIVAWDRLATICHEHLSKGRLVYIEGRLRTRTYESNGVKQYRTEIVASDMLMLDSYGGGEAQPEEPAASNAGQQAPRREAERSAQGSKSSAPGATTVANSRNKRPPAEDIDLEDAEDMPF